MRVLLALALLIWGTSDAHHTPQHSLKEPIFLTGKTSQYDFSLNLTAGIPGMTSQLAKSSILGVVSITPVSESEFLLKVDNVKLSRPEVGIQSDEEDMSYRRESSLETELQKPIKFTLEDGKVKSYTLGRNESPECKAIKRSILRHFQGTFKSENDDENQEYPYNYNRTWETPVPSLTWYVVTVSPYPEFPNEQNVYNISATTMYEYPRYTVVHEHHNFERRGCPEVCKPQRYDNEEKSNKCNAGCPVGYEPHQMPVKEYWNGQYNFRQEGEEMILESLRMEEKHIASMYDQDMDITIRAEYQHKAFSSKPVEEPRDQETYGELEQDIVPDVKSRQDVSRDAAIFAELYLLKVPTVVERCTTLLNKIVETVIENKLESSKSQEVGEDLILLQKILSLLKPEHFQQIWSRIVDKRSYKSADDKETIKRQIIVDVLPLVGTSDCLEFIKLLIQEDKLTAWEIKEILSALPQNLWKYNKKNLQILEEIRQLPQIERHQLTHSAAYIAVAQVIKEACTKFEINRNYKYSMPKSSKSASRFQRTFSRRHDNEEDDEPEKRFSRLNVGIPESEVECPRQLVDRFIEDVYRKLKSTQKVGEKAIYIGVLANTGSRRVLEYLTPYINASAPELESWAPADVDYLQSITLYSLHHLARTCPTEVLEYTSPIYFNRTETPRVRIAAFSALLRSQPPMAVLHQIARNTWQETSNEVGSYVYSALTTFGNASEPCLQLLKQRIQHIISQCKNYDIGFQHAKSFLHTFFDEVRNFGFENRFAYVPSNASAVPYSIYTGLLYNLDSLKDTLYRLSIHMQGIPTEKLYKLVDEVVLGLKIKNIPQEKEDKIFGSANIISRMPQTMRFFVYQKLFYSTHYIYADVESFLKTFEPLFEHLENIFPSSGNIRKGHCVKVFIPSSLHSLSIGYVATYPVEMDVRHPLLLSLKGEFELRKSELEVKAKVTPSIFYMEHKTNHIWGPVSKQVYGVYQEQKLSWTMPLEVACRLHQRNQTVSVDIKWPEMNKRILRYHSEAGTYASPITFDRLPSKINRQPIETIPVMFRKEQVLGLPTLPHLYITAHTEDMAFGYNDIPRTWEECVDLAIQHLRNPGWRRKSINATLVPSPEGRSQEHSARIQFSYKLSLKARNLQYPSEEINKYSMDEDTSEKEMFHRIRGNSLIHKNPGLQKPDAELIYKEMRESPHIAHEFWIQAYSWPNNGYAELKMELNHTYDKTKYCFTAQGQAQTKDRRSPFKACVAHATKYGYIPSELKYKSNVYEKQQMDFYNEISFSSDCDIFKTPQLITQGTFTHKPHQDVLHEEFESSLDERWLLPETHEQCIKDMRDGMDLSLDCIKAIREETVYNNYRIVSEWRNEIPPVVRNITEKLNQAIKYAFYTQADIDTLTKNTESTIEVNVDYVTKLTDNPILNIRVQTPRETVHYHKIDGTYFQPASSVHSLHEYALNDLTNNTYLPTCAIMKEHVKTFDHKTLRLPEDSCTYMLSAHCVQEKLFAIAAKNLKGSRTELTVYIGEHEVVLHPSRGSSYQVEFNSQRQDVHMKSPVVLDKEAGIYVHVVPAGNSKYNLVLKCAAGLKIVYDGENVKIYVLPIYKGKLCGLCSEFDGELTREYRGADQCLYMDEQDFAHSAIIDSRLCGVSATPKSPRLCSYGSESVSNSDSDSSYHTASKLRPKLRTVHMHKSDKVCFSTQPAYMCPDDVEPEETERETLEFHCLPKHDATTRKLVTESKFRILRELSNKRVDFSETISTAKSCRE